MQEFQTSGRTINRMLDEVRKEDGLFYDEILAEKISLVLTKVLLEARAEAGRKHKGKFMISNEDAEAMLNKIMYEGASLRSLAKEKGCSHTTIANAISRIATEEVKKANLKFSNGDNQFIFIFLFVRVFVHIVIFVKFFIMIVGLNLILKS